MSVHPVHIVAIAPIEHHAALEALGLALGHSGREWMLRLSASGTEPATHVATVPMMRAETWAAWQALAANPAFAPAVEGYTPETIAAAITSTTLDALDLSADPVSAWGGSASAHLDAVLTARGLKRIEATGL